jgi:hypothetical protein
MGKRQRVREEGEGERVRVIDERKPGKRVDKCTSPLTALFKIGRDQTRF